VLSADFQISVYCNNSQQKFCWKTCHLFLKITVFVDTLLAYFSAFRDSSKLADDGLMQQIISVLALPPNASCHKNTGND